MIIHGKVVTGLGIGTKIGYPTANLECGDVELPAPGVYAARAIVDGATYHAALIIGARIEPVQISAPQKFQSGKHGKPLIEVHLLDFHGDLRDQELAVEVLKKVSVIELIENEETLVNKIEEDIKQVKIYFA